MLARQLGPAGASRIAPLRALREAGVHVALSTDNVPPSLFDAIHHAVARKPRGATAPVGPTSASRARRRSPAPRARAPTSRSRRT